MTSTKYRVFLRNAGTGRLLYLLWVKLDGEEFYWGSPRPSPDVPATFVGPGPTTILIPDDFDQLPTAMSKTTFHASGVTHVTSTGSGSQVIPDRFVGPVTDFQRPTMFAAMYTAVPSTKDPYARTVTRGGSRALILEVDADDWGCRWYVDFLITPAGTFDGVPGVGLSGGAVPPVWVTQTLDLKLNLILAVRAAPISGDLNTWHAEKHLLIAVTPAHDLSPAQEHGNDS